MPADEYTLDHLDAMIDAFDKVGFEPVVKAGHADGQEVAKEARKVFGAPSLGNVERVYRRGDVLLADLTNIPRCFDKGEGLLPRHMTHTEREIVGFAAFEDLVAAFDQLAFVIKKVIVRVL